jgi:hypothetical protein
MSVQSNVHDRLVRENVVRKPPKTGRTVQFVGRERRRRERRKKGAAACPYSGKSRTNLVQTPMILRKRNAFVPKAAFFQDKSNRTDVGNRCGFTHG